MPLPLPGGDVEGAGRIAAGDLPGQIQRHRRPPDVAGQDSRCAENRGKTCDVDPVTAGTGGAIAAEAP
jgi:hypothetical protein